VGKLALAIILALLLCAGLSGCDVTSEGIVVKVTPEEIQEKVDKAFPITETYLLVFKLTLADPVVELTEGSDRIGFSLSAGTNVSVEGEDLTGRAKMTAGVRYDRDKGALYLADPKVESLNLSLLPEKYEDDVLVAANLAAKKYLKQYEVYRLDKADFKQVLAKMALKDVVVEEGVLKLIFGPGG